MRKNKVLKKVDLSLKYNFTAKRVREVYDDNRSPTCQKANDGDEEYLCDLNGSLDVMFSLVEEDCKVPRTFCWCFRIFLKTRK